MEIQEIKQRLTLSTVLQYYDLKPDRNHRLCCPFHNDKIPSLQVYLETNTVFCFSSNCKTHGKSLDVIDFIMYKENCSKHEALKQASLLIENGKWKMENAGSNPELLKSSNLEIEKAECERNKPDKTDKVDEVDKRVEFLEKMFLYFTHSVYNSPPAREYIQSRHLDYKRLAIGYNAGQFHHGKRKDESLIAQCLEYGLLLDKHLKGHNGEKIYSVFGKNSIVFGLRNKKGEIVSLYFRSILNNKDQRHYYLKNRQGLYPGYPPSDTKILILTESIIDAATLIEHGDLKMENYAVLACYGTNGLMEEHIQAIKALKQLKEIIFFFDGDESGYKAVEKYGNLLKEITTSRLSYVACPENEDINSLLQGHDAAILSHLTGERQEVNFSFSTENKTIEKEQAVIPNEQLNEPAPLLDTFHAHNLKFRSLTALYQVKGFRSEQGDSLKITLQITKA